MHVTMLLNALAPAISSAKRAANTAKNPLIKQCHEQEHAQLIALQINIQKYEKEWAALLEKTSK